MTTYTKNTGETFETRAIGKRADMLFFADRKAALNKKYAPEGKQVNSIRIDWNENGAWTHNGKDRFDLKVTLCAVTAPEPYAARIDTLMDGGKDRMGMLRR